MQELLSLLDETLGRLSEGQAHLPPVQPDVDVEALRDVLIKTAERMQDNYPYGHPLFFGQMLKPPHPVAWLAYALAMTVNPNNHALDGGRASAGMEREAVAGIARPADARRGAARQRARGRVGAGDCVDRSGHPQRRALRGR